MWPLRIDFGVCAAFGRRVRVLGDRLGLGAPAQELKGAETDHDTATAITAAG
jgi:hypothetical protein